MAKKVADADPAVLVVPPCPASVCQHAIISDLGVAAEVRPTPEGVTITGRKMGGFENSETQLKLCGPHRELALRAKLFLKR